MDPIFTFAIFAIVLTAVYLIAMQIPFLEPFKRILQIVFGAIVIIALINFMRGFIWVWPNILKYYKLGLAFLAVVSLLMLYIYAQNMRNQRDSLKTKLVQSEANFAACEKDVEKRDTASRETQSKLSDLATRLATERRLRASARCIPIIKTAPRSTGSLSWRFPNYHASRFRGRRRASRHLADRICRRSGSLPYQAWRAAKLGALGYILLFTACYFIKGGALGKIHAYRLIEKKNKYYAAILDGSYISSFLMAAFINPVFALFWFIGNSPDIGDAARNWKLGVQRGIFLGACLTFATGLTGGPNIWLIIAGATFPIWYIGSLKLTHGMTWMWAEIVFGAVLGISYVS